MTTRAAQRDDRREAAAAAAEGGGNVDGAEEGGQAREGWGAEADASQTGADGGGGGLLLRAFNQPNLGRDYGALFVRGCVLLVEKALARRGVILCRDLSHVREAVLRLTAQLEAELLAARQTAEAQAFATPSLPPEPAPFAPRDQAAHTTEAGDAGPPREPPPAPSMQLLALVDEVKHLPLALPCGLALEHWRRFRQCFDPPSSLRLPWDAPAAEARGITRGASEAELCRAPPDSPLHMPVLVPRALRCV